MPNKIWEITTVVERYNIDDEPLLWAECMRLLQDNPEEFLKEPLSNFAEVNDGFAEAKNWLISQGLNATDGTLLYALQFTAYTILLKAKDKDNKPTDLTDEWLRLKTIDIKDAYSKLPSSSKGLLDILGTTILTLGCPFENPRVNNAANFTIVMTLMLALLLNLVVLGNRIRPRIHRHDDLLDDLDEEVSILLWIQWMKSIGHYSGWCTSLLFSGKFGWQEAYSFFNDRQRVKSTYLPEPGPEAVLESQNINP